MKKSQWYLNSFLTSAIVFLPLAVRAANLQHQNQPYQLAADDDRRDRDVKRYYDRDRKEYHEWDEREDRAYRRWMKDEKRRAYRPFGRLSANEQREYWKWRHEHRDNDRDRHDNEKDRHDNDRDRH